ncbi:DsbA family protein [Falsirhodobacter algicola]|uniref:Thioredoxin domain-containing protein n=1 Tax=Falsirhodobacter algicola TaxID=2692330 RepID=A0A8J8MRL2_9RHOB|nr:DsbA family protein [Falsirhodobacter algicola]QUS35091.1 thioredoxin domain-containing protein [Falsirhodobacter algicola]
MKLLALSALVAGLAAPALAQDMTDAERQVFRKEVRDYLMDNPEVLMEAIGVLEERQQAQQADSDTALVQQNAAALFATPADWVGGNPQGDVTVVEFMDYRCGYCRQAFAEVEDLVTADGNIRFVLKEFPILGDASVLASRFALAVKMTAGDEAYKTVHDRFFDLRGEVTEATLTRMASDLGLDWSAIRERMDSAEVTQVIADNHALAQQLQIQGTPTFVIGESMLRGYLSEEGMAQMVAQERRG